MGHCLHYMFLDSACGYAEFVGHVAVGSPPVVALLEYVTRAFGQGVELALHRLDTTLAQNQVGIAVVGHGNMSPAVKAVAHADVLHVGESLVSDTGIQVAAHLFGIDVVPVFPHGGKTVAHDVAAGLGVAHNLQGCGKAPPVFLAEHCFKFFYSKYAHLAGLIKRGTHRGRNMPDVLSYHSIRPTACNLSACKINLILTKIRLANVNNTETDIHNLPYGPSHGPCNDSTTALNWQYNGLEPAVQRP